MHFFSFVVCVHLSTNMFMSLISPKLTAQQSELYLLRKIIFILINIVLVGQWKYTGKKKNTISFIQIWDINDFLWENDQSFLVDSLQKCLIRRILTFISILFDCTGLILVYRLSSKGLTWVFLFSVTRIFL